jgi:ankyrin repeat protein
MCDSRLSLSLSLSAGGPEIKLTSAADAQQTYVVKRLIEKGADVNIMSKSGHPLEYAIGYDQEEIAMMLLDTVRFLTVLFWFHPTKVRLPGQGGRE